MDDLTMPDILCKQDHFASINIKKDHCKQKSFNNNSIPWKINLACVLSNKTVTT